MTNRSRDVGSLFQRIEAMQSESRDPNVAQRAAQATEAWPLLAALTGRPATGGRSVSPAPRFAEPIASALAAPEMPEPRHATPATPSPSQDPTPQAHLSPLEQMFARLDRSPANAPAKHRQPDIVAPSGAGYIAPRPSAMPSLPPLTPRPMAATADHPVTLEPRERQRHEPEAVPARLFERIASR